MSARTVCIIQARMGSTRLPGKVLLDLSGQSVLERTVRRAQRATRLDDVIVATTVAPEDGRIVEACARMGVGVYRGSAEDVLDRYYQAALAANATVICRITSDCPFIDPEVVDLVLETFAASGADYASNTIDRTFPRGLDVEAFTFDALHTAQREARLPHQREHVTPFLYEHPERFELCSVHADRDASACRWTIDTADDLAFARAACALVEGDDRVSWRTLAEALGAHPEVVRLNAHVEQKAVRAP